MRLLAISGSLRATSSNTALLQAASTLAPAPVEIRLYEGLGHLPHYNPDLDGDTVPPVVRDLREQIGAAHGLLISSPEYAHGIPGVLKNGLDWLVGSVEFPGKPVVLLNASPRATHALASLIEVLTTMSARLVPEAFVTLPLLGKTPDAALIARDPAFSGPLRSAIAAFMRAIDAG